MQRDKGTKFAYNKYYCTCAYTKAFYKHKFLYSTPPLLWNTVAVSMSSLY